MPLPVAAASDSVPNSRKIKMQLQIQIHLAVATHSPDRKDIYLYTKIVAHSKDKRDEKCKCRRSLAHFQQHFLWHVACGRLHSLCV